MTRDLKSVLKHIRSSQPFNCVSTSTVRAILRTIGVRSEFVTKHMCRVGMVCSGLPNGRTLRLWSRGDDWVSNQVYWRGWRGYEPEMTPLFFRLAARSSAVLDVGAYVGYYTLLAAHANPESRVYAFEPMPSIYARLTRNVALNGLRNVVCTACAVGEADGYAEFYHAPFELPTSSSLSREFMASTPALTHSTVRVVTLEQFAREHGLERIDLLKVDTESTEPQVLKGMGRLLSEDRPTIFCEVLKGRGSEADLEEILRPLGYKFYLLTGDGPAPRERIKGHGEWLNYLFTPLGPEEVGGL
jgi:FkbM family methyltransferase